LFGSLEDVGVHPQGHRRVGVAEAAGDGAHVVPTAVGITPLSVQRLTPTLLLNVQAGDGAGDDEALDL
jgi:hypothetical protein